MLCFSEFWTRDYYYYYYITLNDFKSTWIFNTSLMCTQKFIKFRVWNFLLLFIPRNQTKIVFRYFFPDKVLHNGITVLPSHPDSVNRCCTRKVLYKRLPILQWLPKYTFKDHGVSDLVAGVTVGLTVIPQAIAFANVAGLPPQVSDIVHVLCKNVRANF